MTAITLAWRSVFRNKRRSSLVGGAAALSALVLTLTGAFVSGTAADMRASIIKGGRGHFQIARAEGFDGYSENQLDYALTPADVSTVRVWSARQPTLQALVPRLTFGGLISDGPRTVNFSGSGIDPAAERAAFTSNLTYVSGGPLDASTGSEVVIGQGIAEQLHLRVGSQATLLSTTTSGAMNALDVVVRGIVSTGSPEADKSYLQAPLALAQGLLATDRVSRLAVLAKSDAVATALQASAQNLGHHFEVKDWRALTPIFKQILAMYGGIFLFFGFTLCTVSAFTIGGAVLTSVLERTAEIGLMRALALKRSTVRGMFVGEGAILGFLGSIIGAAMGLALATALNASHLMMPPPPGATRGYPLRLDWTLGLAIELVVVFVVLATFAAWAVSGRASKLSVMQAFAAE